MRQNAGVATLVLLTLTLASAAAAGDNTWTSAGPEGGSVLAIAIHPSSPLTAYAGTGGLGFGDYMWSGGGGVYKTTDGGTSFTAATAGLPGVLAGSYGIAVRAIDPAHPERSFAGSEGFGVFSRTFPTNPTGDTNGDGVIAVGDVFHLINSLFAGGPGAIGSGDANGDGQVTVADVFHLINYLFAAGPAPV